MVRYFTAIKETFLFNLLMPNGSKWSDTYENFSKFKIYYKFQDDMLPYLRIASPQSWALRALKG